MNYAIIVAVVVGIVNLVALGVVAWQTYLTRKSVQLSQEELLESQHASLIANLPKAYSVIDVQNSLHGWKEDLELLISRESQLRDLIKSANCDGKFEFRYWHGSPEGLIDKKSYDYLPDWLQHIQMAGVRHYYSGMSLVDLICSSKGTQDFRLRLVDDMIGRAQESRNYITQMLAFIDRLLPRWYLESPASLNDWQFWDSGNRENR